MVQLERTLVLCKPDAVTRGIVGLVITRFEQVGLKIVGIKMVKPDRDLLYHHYETIGTMITRRGEQAFNRNLEAMQKSPVIAMVLEGVEAVSLVRKLAGATESKSAAPGTIRGDFSHMSFAYADAQNKGVPNVIHASGDPEEAKQEIELWFKPEELYEYSRGDAEFVN